VKVRIYVEGGPKGAHADGLRRFRNGFKQHFLKLDPRLNSLEVSPCGSTEDTVRDYGRAVNENEQDCLVALLVDSDESVIAETPAKHLQAKLNSAKIPPNARENVFLMVQCMEAWLVTDVAALEKCFGKKLKATALPTNPNIEAVPKKDVLDALASAVRPTPGGPYHKIEHGAKILAELNPDRVGQRSAHARNLHSFLRTSAQMQVA
jgi:hypothetical protein